MRLAVHGNCQVVALKLLILEACPDWKVDCFEVHQLRIDDELEHYRTTIQQADVILSQPVSDDYRGCVELSHRWIRDAARPDAKVISFPVLYFEGYHPTCFFLNGRTEILAHPGWFAHFGDGVALKGVLEGIETDDIVERLLSHHLISFDAVIANATRSLDELRRREESEAIAIRASGFIASHWRKLQLFHIVNHPSRAVMAHVANQALELMGLPQRVSPLGKDHWADEHFPSLPCVAALHSPIDPELTSLSEDEWDQFRFKANVASRADYYRDFIGALRNRDPADLEHALRAVTPALQRLGL